MPITDPEHRLQVVVGVLEDGHGKYLIQQRPAGKPCAGQWEFPGGKIEPGESLQSALARELHEELGINMTSCRELMRHAQDYEHANVYLNVFIVDGFNSVATGMEGQLIQWAQVAEIKNMDVLEAVHPILERLATIN